MRWRGARRIGDCSGRCISKFRFSRLLPPDTPRRAVCPGREAPVPGCRVPARFKGCGGQGGEGGNRNPPKLPLPAEHVFASSADDALLIGGSDLLLMLLGRTRSARPRGLGGLKPCARSAGKSMAEIGNRKERLRDYASFPDDFDLPRSKVATGLLPFAWDAPPR